MKFIYIIHGDYPLDHLKESLRCVRRFIPYASTELWTDKPRGARVDKEIVYDGAEYAALPGVEASDKIRVKALLAEPIEGEVCCYLDSDIYPVSEHFENGFEIAASFGLAMPANPRSFVTCAHGTGDMDLSVENKNACFDYWTPVNLGMIFYDPSNECARKFLCVWQQQKQRPRDAFYATAYLTGYHPYILAQQFCADVIYQNMLAMHVGGKYHAHMLEHYNMYHRA